jgi:undecaprenyl-diphosphatase
MEFAAYAIVRYNGPEYSNMNTRLFFDINHLAGKHHLLDKLMIASAKDLIYLLFLAAAAWVVYAAYKREWRLAGFFVGNLILTFGLLLIASKLYVDHRPFVDHHVTQLVPHASGKSFPSDHTTASMAVALGFVFFSRFRWLGFIFIPLALLVGFARIFVGVHYPVDVLGGIIVAIIGSLITLAIYRYTDKGNDTVYRLGEKVQQ